MTAASRHAAADDCGWLAFEDAVGSFREPPSDAMSTMASPRLAQAWAQALVMYWSRLERLGALDLTQPLYVLDVAPGDGSLAAGVLHALRREMRAHGMIGWPLRYVCCPLPGASGAPAPLPWPASLLSFARGGILDAGQWAARTGSPLLIGASRFPLFGVRNPVAAVCAGGFSAQPAQLWGVHMGELSQGEVRVAAPDASGRNAFEYRWQPAHASGVDAAVLEHYREGITSAAFIVSESTLAFVNALSDFSAGGYLLLAADHGIAEDRAVRAGAMSPPAEAWRGRTLVPVNFNALAFHQQRAGARCANLQWSGIDSILHVACRHDRVSFDDAAWQGIVECADRGHPADRWWPRFAASLNEAQRIVLRLRAASHDGWALADVLRGIARQWPQVVDEACDNTRDSLREALARAWKRLPPAQRTDPIREALVDAAFALDAWAFARDVLEDVAAHPQFAQHRARLAEATGEACTHREGDLALDTLGERHVAALLHQMRDPLIAQATGVPDLASPGQLAIHLADIAAKGGSEMALVHRDFGFVGAAGYVRVEDTAHVHFWIGMDHQGKGFGNAALDLLLRWLQMHGVAHAFTSVHESNARSRRVLARNGFVPVPYRGRGEDAEYRFLHKRLREPTARMAPADLGKTLARVCAAAGAPLVSLDHH